MGHAHGHRDGHDHGHGGRRKADRKALRIALALTFTFMVVEIAGGLITGSLALLADAVHMLSDNFSLVLALVAIGLASRPPTPQRSFGWQRAEILAALANGILLAVVSVWILWEAYGRLETPEPVKGPGMLAVAALGAVVNIIAFKVLSPGSGESLNVAGALRHVLADLAGSVGAIVAAVVIILTGWDQADPIIGGLIAILIAFSAIPIIRDSLRVLLEETPAGMNAEEIGKAMAAAPGVESVHDLHVWEITSGFPALSAHVVVGTEEDCHARRAELEAMLKERFGIGHTTLQTDHAAPPELLQVGGLDEPDEAPRAP
jgi:cobalt-zinc-cadmium efflux system protein